MHGSRLAALAWLALAAPSPAAGAEVKALVGGRLIDGFGGEPVEQSVVVVEGERIVAAGAADEIAIPPGAERISTEGMSVLPGLWDMHVHLMVVGHSDYEHWDRTYPDSGVPLNFHSDSTWREIDTWVRVFGVDPMEALRAATYWPAVHQGVVDEVGTVSPGKYADIIAVRGDVLLYPNLLQDVDLVIRRGKRYR